jgi:hypothetical protein
VTDSPHLRADPEVIAYFRKRLAEWESWAKRSREQTQRLIDRNKVLSAEVTALEKKLARLVEQVRPVNRRLFQGRRATTKTQ